MSIMHNPPHPGKILKELYLVPASTVKTESELADKTRLKKAWIERFVAGEVGLDKFSAKQIASVWPNTTAALWLKLQQQYDHQHESAH